MTLNERGREQKEKEKKEREIERNRDLNLGISYHKYVKNRIQNRFLSTKLPFEFVCDCRKFKVVIL